MNFYLECSTRQDVYNPEEEKGKEEKGKEENKRERSSSKRRNTH